MVEHPGVRPYHREVTTNFVHWYPLREASLHAPDTPGVFQVRVSTGLLEYPGGKSAMVHYGRAESLRSELVALALQHKEADFLCRHQSAKDPSVLLEFVLSQFQRRFGISPSWPATPGPTEGTST